MSKDQFEALCRSDRVLRSSRKRSLQQDDNSNQTSSKRQRLNSQMSVTHDHDYSSPLEGSNSQELIDGDRPSDCVCGKYYTEL